MIHLVPRVKRDTDEVVPEVTTDGTTRAVRVGGGAAWLTLQEGQYVPWTTMLAARSGPVSAAGADTGRSCGSGAAHMLVAA